MQNVKEVAMTGVTGNMGFAALREFAADPGRYHITALVRESRKNRRKIAPFVKSGLLTPVWGDLRDYDAVKKLVNSAPLLLHIGGMVSPAADWYPEKTYATNTKAMENICKAILSSRDAASKAVVYIGSVSQYGDRFADAPWGDASDPMTPSLFDAYARSKVDAEEMLRKSGIRKWVSLRQTGILSPALLAKGTDPITFHVPFNGVLEWVTVEDSGRLMERIARNDPPDDFWGKCYNIGGGEGFRLTNYEFECRLLKAIGCPPPEKAFGYNWFATRNFHGMWFRDSDKLEEMFHFRAPGNADDYFKEMKRRGPWWLAVVPMVPAWLIRAFMKRIAKTTRLGPLWWIENNVTDRINAAFGSRQEWEALPESWEKVTLPAPPDRKTPLC